MYLRPISASQDQSEKSRLRVKTKIENSYYFSPVTKIPNKNNYKNKTKCEYFISMAYRIDSRQNSRWRLVRPHFGVRGQPRTYSMLLFFSLLPKKGDGLEVRNGFPGKIYFFLLLRKIFKLLESEIFTGFKRGDRCARVIGRGSGRKLSPGSLVSKY